jgi:DNA-binding transcriptional ArsR family regulator
MAAKSRAIDPREVASASSAPSAKSRQGKAKSSIDLDRLIHERTRLAIVSALAANSMLTFTDLKSLLQVSDGNLSAHARKLEDAGYLTCNKSFDGRIPRTEFSLTASGRDALNRYIKHMESLIKAMKKL